MKKRLIVTGFALFLIISGAFSASSDKNALKIEKGPFQPTEESLSKYKCSDWFRDAKLGFWAHCEP